MIFETIVSLVLLLCFLHCYTRYGRVGRLVKNIPGLPDWPMVGGLPYLMKAPGADLNLILKRVKNFKELEVTNIMVQF